MPGDSPHLNVVKHESPIYKIQNQLSKRNFIFEFSRSEKPQICVAFNVFEDLISQTKIHNSTLLDLIKLT